MIITPAPFKGALSIAVVLILLLFLITYELLNDEKKEQVKGFMTAAILALLSAAALIFIHRLEAIL